MATGAMSIERALMRGYFALVEPALFRLKKPARLRHCGYADLSQLPIARLELAAGPSSGDFERSMVEDHERFLAKFAHAGQPNGNWKGLASLIDLAPYADGEAYRQAIRKATSRGITRELRQAERLGYYCRPYDRHAYGDDFYEIETSKLFRTGGPVVKALLRKLGREDRAVRADPWLASPSPTHWTQDWGVFIRTPEGRERLVAAIVLRRIGNMARMVSIMGHAADLPNGALKLLFVEIVSWLLSPDVPQARGVRYVLGGALEHGRMGLVDWKLRLQFRPHLLARTDP